MMTGVTKEVCGHCQKCINTGNVVICCYSCNMIVHTKCAKQLKYTKINHAIYCPACSIGIEVKYNPFKYTYDTEDDSSDIPDDIIKVMSILENCKSYNSQEFTAGLDSQHLDKSNISLCFNNLDGNKSNFDTLMAQLESINHDNFSIIGLAETNTDPAESSVFQLDNYNSFYQPTLPGKQKGSGVAIYVSKKLNATLNSQLSNTSTDLETIFIDVTNDDRPFTVGVIYRPPSGNLEKSLAELSNILETLQSSSVYLLGDFNVDMHAENKIDLKSEMNNVEKFESTVITSGYYPTISTYTHERPNCRSSCIDNILTNNIGSILLSGTLINKVSDHLPIFSFIDVHESLEGGKYTQYYDYSKQNIENFINELPKELDESLETDFDMFVDKFSKLIDNHCKLDKPKTSKRNNKNNPWITQGLINSIKTNECLYKSWKKSFTKKSPKGNRALYEKYSIFRKNLRKLIKSAKAKFYCKKISENKGNPKKTWQILNQLRGKTQTPINPQFVIDNETITDRRIIANEFNKYFNSIASNMNENLSATNDGIPLSPLPNFENYIPNPCESTIFMYDCTEAEVNNLIAELQNGKSSDIPIKIIKKASPIITPYLTSYYNHFMSNGIFPDILKTGRVNPIYKKENPQLLENYRPISTLPIFGKIFEKIIYSRLYNFLSSKNILHENQFGFRSEHSTTHALNYSVSYIEESLKKQNHVLGVFIDLSKAFDTLDHQILLNKLHNYGIRGVANNLLNSYLTNRSQYTSILDVNSDKLLIRYGVPQGSVLGPLLFLIYINDICNSSDLAKFVLFADDSNIFVEAKSKAEVFRITNQVLNNVSKYMKSNKLHINLKKCCYIYFNPRKIGTSEHLESIDPTPQLLLDGIAIKRVSETRFLGIIIDEKLSWLPHVKQLVTKLCSCIGRLNRIKNFVPIDIFIDLYNTLFQSHLSYGISVWGGLSKNKLSPLFIVQKKCIRILFGDNVKYNDKFKTCARTRAYGLQKLGTSFYEKEKSKPLFNQLNILCVHNLYKYHCLLEFFKVLKTYTPKSIYSLFQISSRKDTLIITPKPSFNFTYKAASLWNNYRSKLLVANDIRMTISKFKNNLKVKLLKDQHMHDPLEWNDLNY